MELAVPLWNLLLSLMLSVLAVFLASVRREGLFAAVILLSLYAVRQVLLAPDLDPRQLMGFVKFVCILPLGLGVVLAYGLLSEERQKLWSKAFHVYINGAVIANICMMMLTPSGGTNRGTAGRVVCLLLLIWLCQEMRRLEWKTSESKRGFFIFRAAPLSWIICHALYRISLLSLPIFDSLNYLLLEPLSLFAMYVLYRVQVRQYPLAQSFGYADTLIVTVLAGTSQYVELPSIWIHLPAVFSGFRYELDGMMVPMQILVAGFSLWAIVQNLQRADH